MNPSKCFAIAIFGLTLSVGCAQNTPPPPAVVMAAPPDGTYTKTLTKAEMSPGRSESDACEMAGTYYLTVTGNRWIMNEVPVPGCTPTTISISGSWRITGEQVAFHEDRNIGCDQDSTYKWSFDGTALTLKQVQDICAGRIVVNTLHPWVKTSAPPPAPTVAIATPAPNATIAPTAAQLPDGTYQTSENGFGLKLAGGQWSVGFARSLALGGYIAAGSYQVTGDQITFTEERFSSDATCSSADNIYTYKWAFDATKKSLSFTNVKDNCSDRMNVWTQNPWIKQP